MHSICGIDCTACELNSTCHGCAETNGHPFGGACVVASCCQTGMSTPDKLKETLIAAFHALDIPDMEAVTDLHPLKGSFVNLEYRLPNGQTVKLWDDNRIYLGNQLHKSGSERCYGIVADERYLMVAEYGCCGSDAEIVVFQRWNETTPITD